MLLSRNFLKIFLIGLFFIGVTFSFSRLVNNLNPSWNIISAVFSDEVSDLEDEIQQNEDLKKEKEKILDDIQKDIDEISNSNASISSKIATLGKEIDVIQQDVDEREAAVKKQQSELDKQIEDYDKKEKVYKKMVTDIYKSSKLGALDVFLSKNNGSDLFRAYTIYQKVSQKQNEVLTSLSQDMIAIQNTKKELEYELELVEVKKQGLDDAMALLKDEQVRIQQLAKVRAAQASNLNKEIYDLNDELSSLSGALQDAILAKIVDPGDSTGGGIGGSPISPQPVTGNAGTYKVYLGVNLIDTVSGPIRVVPVGDSIINVNSSGANRTYRGIYEMRSDTDVYVINELPFEQYLYGLGEVPSSWNIEALKAQSVAARSYAQANWNKRTSSGYNLQDNTSDQNYVGYSKESGLYGGNWVSAVAATQSKVLYKDGSLVTAYYYSDAGGHTLASQDVWGGYRSYAVATSDRTTSRDSYGDLLAYNSSSPYAQKFWGEGSGTITDATLMDLANAAIYITLYPNKNADIISPSRGGKTASELETALGSNSIQAKIGNLQNAQSVYNNGSTTIEIDSKYTSSMKFTGSAGVFEIDGSKFRTAYNGRSPGTMTLAWSNLWTTRKVSGQWKLYSRGFGHRVGMSQYGAQGHALAGQTYADILSHYYNGATLNSIDTNKNIRIGISRISSGTQKFTINSGSGFVVYSNGNLVTTAISGQEVKVVKQ